MADTTHKLRLIIKALKDSGEGIAVKTTDELTTKQQQ